MKTYKAYFNCGELVFETDGDILSATESAKVLAEHFTDWEFGTYELLKVEKI